MEYNVFFIPSFQLLLSNNTISKSLNLLESFIQKNSFYSKDKIER